MDSNHRCLLSWIFIATNEQNSLFRSVVPRSLEIFLQNRQFIRPMFSSRLVVAHLHNATFESLLELDGPLTGLHKP